MHESKNVDSWVSEHDPALRQIAQTIRNLIKSTAPELRETIQYGNPTYRGTRNVMYILATDTYVTLGFFNGTVSNIAPSHSVIGGTGSGIRQVKIKAIEDIDHSLVQSWIRVAASLDR